MTLAHHATRVTRPGHCQRTRVRTKCPAFSVRIFSSVLGCPPSFPSRSVTQLRAGVPSRNVFAEALSRPPFSASQVAGVRPVGTQTRLLFGVVLVDSPPSCALL